VLFNEKCELKRSRVAGDKMTRTYQQEVISK